MSQIGRKEPLKGPRVFPEAGTKAQMSMVIGPVFGWNWEGGVASGIR